MSEPAPKTATPETPAPAAPAAPSRTTLIRRRTTVGFLVFLLVALSAASFASIAFGWGKDWSGSPEQDLGTPTQLSSTEPFYVLAIGSDALEGTALYTADMKGKSEYAPHADAITLVRVDPAALDLTLISVPADTVLYEADARLRDTLSDSGPEQTVYLVERLTGVSIRNYFLLNYASFEELVNSMDSITLDVPSAITEQDPLTARKITVKAGKSQKLDGAHALAYMRASNYPADIDAHRQQNVRNVESSLISRVFELDDNKVRAVLGVFESGVKSNMDNAELLALVTRFYSNKEDVNVYSCTGPYLTTGLDSNGAPIIRTPPSMWRELMTIVDAGENPADYPRYTYGS